MDYAATALPCSSYKMQFVDYLERTTQLFNLDIFLNL